MSDIPPVQNASHESWRTQPEAGSLLAVKLMVGLVRLLGRRVVGWFLHPVAAYFYLVRSRERKVSQRFYRQVLGRAPKPADSYRQFYNFARVTADRVLLLGGEPDRIPVKFTGEQANAAVAPDRPAGIFLAAHFGSFEAARVVGSDIGDVEMSIVLDRAMNARIVETLEQLNPRMAELVIDAGQNSMELGLAIGDALKKGRWVGFLADRYRPGDRTQTCDFMGKSAQFPVGPWIIASLFKVPVIGVFSHCTEDGYEVFGEILSERLDIPRSQRAQELAKHTQNYADRLAHHVQASPYSWFNFFDFWAQEDADD